jgi:hypothetical protein
MAGDPRECRAGRFLLGTAETANEQEKEHLSNLAWAWEQLPVEHEDAQAFLRTMEAVTAGLEADTAVTSPMAPYGDNRRLPCQH